LPDTTIQAWIAANGDRTFRLNYDLNPNSIVFDAGGYQGQWASDIFSRFLCHIHIFEPIPEYASEIRERFARNERISVNNFGLAGTNRFDIVQINAEASSIFPDAAAGAVCRAKFSTVDKYLHMSNINRVDLLKINIEGMEYEVLEHLLENGLISIFQDIQVQFHASISGAEQRMRDLQKRLSSTHHLTYQFPFVWENWRIGSL
jgi:FkbM family methyltransferase